MQRKLEHVTEIGNLIMIMIINNFVITAQNRVVCIYIELLDFSQDCSKCKVWFQPSRLGVKYV